MRGMRMLSYIGIFLGLLLVYSAALSNSPSKFATICLVMFFFAWRATMAEIREMISEKEKENK